MYGYCVQEEKERSQEVGIDVPANDLSARLGGKRTSGSVPNLLVNSSSLQLQTSLDSRYSHVIILMQIWVWLT